MVRVYVDEVVVYVWGVYPAGPVVVKTVPTGHGVVELVVMYRLPVFTLHALIELEESV
jgi:hypothetical protein